jgi:hypothetical protein
MYNIPVGSVRRGPQEGRKHCLNGQTHNVELRRDEWKNTITGNMQEIMTVWSVS